MSTILTDQNHSPTIPYHSAKRTRKILHLINGEYYSGAERVQDLLAMSLPEFGYEVSFACVKSNRFPQQRLSQESTLYDVEMRSKFDISIGKRIAEIYRNGNYDALHAHTPRSVLAARLAWRHLKCPFIYHVHSPVGRDSTRKFQNWMNQRIENWCLKPTHALICVSNSLGTYMKSIGHPERKTHVVPNGVPAMPELVEKNVPDSDWTVGAVALFRPRKGTEVLLQAIAELKKAGHQVKLNAVGPFESKDYENELKALCWNLGIQEQVNWLGFQSDVQSQFEKMDLFVLPSLFGEGLPMVVLESMSFGVPVIAANVEGIPEALRHEKDGLIFEPGSSSELAEQMAAMITRKYDWSTMRKHAFERQSQLFSDRSMANGVSAVYDKLI